jgi:hypothetical protein
MSDNRSRPVGATGICNARHYGLKSSEGILLAQAFHVFWCISVSKQYFAGHQMFNGTSALM